MFTTEFIKKIAIKNWRLYDFKTEWRGVILCALCVKFFTAGVSLSAGFSYLKNLFFAVIPYTFGASLCAFISLAIIEILNAYLLGKFFKFALRGRFGVALPVFVFAGGVFALSFVVSCNGLALYKAQTADNTKEIILKYDNERQQAHAEFNATEQANADAIAIIKANPTIWKGGKLCLLSAEQNAQISTIYNNTTQARAALRKTLEDIAKHEQEEQTANATNTTEQANKYYLICGLIMCIQFVINGVLMFFYSKITGQDEKSIIFAEELQAIDDNLLNTIENRTQKTFNNYFSMLKTSFALNTPNIITQTTNTADTGQNQPTQQDKPASVKSEQKRPIIGGFALGIEQPENNEKTGKKTQKYSKTNEKTDENETPHNNPTPAVGGGLKQEPQSVFLTCPECSQTFARRRENQKFCTTKCRVNNYNKNHPKNPLNVPNNKIK